MKTPHTLSTQVNKYDLEMEQDLRAPCIDLCVCVWLSLTKSFNIPEDTDEEKEAETKFTALLPSAFVP